MRLYSGKTKHRFLRRTVRLCLAMMIAITLSVLALAWHSGEQLDSAAVVALLGAWCTELLMSLLKRKSDNAKEKETGKTVETEESI